MRLAITLFLFILVCATALAQSLPSYKLKRLDASTGLQYDERNVFISEDAKGFIWIGSSAGPYRYDGQQSRLFQFSEDRKRSQVISHFFNLGKEDIWFSTPNGLGHYSYTSDRLVTHDIQVEQAAPLGLQLIQVDTQRNTLWLTNGKELISVLASAPSTVRSYTPSKSVRHLRLPSEGNTETLLGFPWLLGKGIERITFIEGKVLSVDTSRDATIQNLTITGGAQDANGGVWLCGPEGLHHYDLAKDVFLKTIQLPQAKNPNILDVKQHGELLLIATKADGVWWFDPERGRFWRKLNIDPKATLAASAEPLSLQVTRAGVIFAARDQGGLDVMVPQEVNCDILLDSLTNDTHGQKIIQDDQGRVYVCRENGEIVVFTPGGKPLTTLRLGTFASAMISKTATGDIYCSAGEVLYKIETSQTPTLSYVMTSPSRIISLLGLDQVMLIHNADGMQLFTKNKLVPLSIGVDIAQNSFIYMLGGNDLLINTFNGKWYTIATEGEADDFRLVSIDSVFAKGELKYASYGYTADTLLIGQIQGLTRYVRNPVGEWTEFDEPISGLRIVAIDQQPNQASWLLTDQGLAYGNHKQWTRIREEHGLPDASGLSNALLVSGDSIVWAGFREGLVRYPIKNRAHSSSSNARTYLQKYFINEKEFAETIERKRHGITFANKGQRLQLQLGTVGIFDQQAAQYRYRFWGGDKQWQNLGNSNNIYLESLSPGRYDLEAEAIDASGESLKAIQVTVFSTQPYWETWWFKLAIIGALSIGISGISYLFYRRRLLSERRKYEKELLLAQERDRIARELHDDLGTDISSILYLSDTDGETLDAEDQAEIVELSQGALARMREIVNALDGGNSSLNSLWKSCVREARAACRRYKVDFVLKDNPGPVLGEVMLNQITRRNLDLLIKESVSNALRHGSPTRISLSLKPVKSKAMLLTIKDDGIGFDEAKIAPGMGLSNLEARAKSLGGKISISSKIGQGTKIRVIIPTGAL